MSIQFEYLPTRVYSQFSRFRVTAFNCLTFISQKQKFDFVLQGRYKQSLQFSLISVLGVKIVKSFTLKCFQFWAMFMVNYKFKWKYFIKLRNKMVHSSEYFVECRKKRFSTRPIWNEEVFFFFSFCATKLLEKWTHFAKNFLLNAALFDYSPKISVLYFSRWN